MRPRVPTSLTQPLTYTLIFSGSHYITLTYQQGLSGYGILAQADPALAVSQSCILHNYYNKIKTLFTEYCVC